MPEELIGDQLRLKQILINLTKNALKFTPRKGRITIYASFDEHDDFLQICISDNGRGIRQEEHEQIFHKFGKLRRTAAQISEGIGLGLMIVKGLVEVNNGEIKFFSNGENMGT